ncbi:hypothetical protein BX616_005782 [Lobosporangium transversale]|uniref:DNA-directed RNA polymerase III subunit n=1 Tax=Lobosporangium transversale TaxID=64571 RepID=A0A1Y2GHE4_9FUNG|nr:DNA-directed RNA polymerase III, subunit Rpc31 [Lobosporangium transversale]KAF9918773.1 hypothetical protein BX616_005782 [Lobosporangium transversale]ORZ09713.1 DNA-directed RNA polymerase III, subunit Rpc31 [Lobosporangium transversale]|eukprot:XP_021878983.1 DNA-directed RNA polymerase III, subunit Rpc31 [Lobosporangium transversale]
MSRGGGRGGRGGGRGGGRSGPNIQMFGPDAIHPTFNNPGETYPDIVLPVAKETTDREIEMFMKMKKLKDIYYSSSYYLTEPRKPSAIVRYTDRYHEDMAATRPKLETIKSNKAFFPDELHSILDPKAVRKRKTVRRNIDLSKLGEDIDEGEEEIDPETGLAKKSTEEDEEVEDEEYEDDEDAEENDYVETYFDNGENDIDLDGDEDAVEY